MVTTHPPWAFEELCGARTPADAPRRSGRWDREPLAFLLSVGEPPPVSVGPEGAFPCLWPLTFPQQLWQSSSL